MYFDIAVVMLKLSAVAAVLGYTLCRMRQRQTIFRIGEYVLTHPCLEFIIVMIPIVLPVAPKATSDSELA